MPNAGGGGSEDECGGAGDDIYGELEVKETESAGEHHETAEDALGYVATFP